LKLAIKKGNASQPLVAGCDVGRQSGTTKQQQTNRNLVNQVQDNTQKIDWPLSDAGISEQSMISKKEG
jgi:hypothetical protein